MNIFDAHCDTLYEITFNNHELCKNNLRIDFNRMSKYDSYTQFFAIWIENEENAMQKFIQMADKFETELSKSKNSKALCFEDIRSAHKNKKCAAFLSLEGAYMVKDENDINFLYDKGIRCLSLTWNNDNKLAGGINSDKGLSPLGKACIKQMQNLGIITDVSHLNEKSFRDVVKISEKPVIASHSNSQKICPNRRNLTDSQFLAICNLGGCVGINFYSKFLTGQNTSNINAIAEHIKHFIKIGGDDFIGIGSDFDGADSFPIGIHDILDMEKIVQNLESAGLSANSIDKITHLNFERIVKEILKS